MKLRNAHSIAITLPGGTVAPGGVADAPESFRNHALVKAGALVVVEEKPQRSGRGSK